MTKPRFIKRTKKTNFRPNRKYIQRAVDEYLKKGGKITWLEISSSDIPIPNNFKDVDSYLIGL